MRVAVLYQSAHPPEVDGAKKPMKESGYADSGADIAFALQSIGIDIATPVKHPDVRRDLDWVFADSVTGIQSALSLGATCFWLNTVLYDSHPITEFVGEGLLAVGQRPDTVGYFDNKFVANSHLRQKGLPMLSSEKFKLDDLLGLMPSKQKPLVVKPILGRGSQGVKVLTALDDVYRYVEQVKDEQIYGDVFMVEPYLEGTEVTISVMPPGTYCRAGKEEVYSQPWCLPLIVRRNHRDGITPYSGTQAVKWNSQVADAEFQGCKVIRKLKDECIEVARQIGIRFVVRIDGRADERGTYYLFDINLKPNMTGNLRPGREDQEGLTSMAAKSMGWNYTSLLQNLLAQHWNL